VSRTIRLYPSCKQAFLNENSIVNSYYEKTVILDIYGADADQKSRI
jgi:hypothetical protein